MQRRSDLDTFYGLLAELESRVGGLRLLGQCHGRMNWPERGVYFFFEPGETRGRNPSASRVVRVGTHALISQSRTTLWKRISQHRGTTNPRGGNHRGSIFRLLSGEAMMTRDPALQIESWGRKSSATREIRANERQHEALVSQYIGAMKLLFVSVPDASGPESARCIIERNAIALLSNYRDATPDQPSSNWLGQSSGRDRVRRSGLWNNNHVDEEYDPAFLGLLEDLVRQTPST
ncbi:hypothetical protein WNZ14_14345 [Hoeflea sp. AS60]|uniref:hypothetical protein n=1 Tax=Hoeflea sp. AS60 TaxID=3135780 RepID=UPI00317731E4